MSTFQVFRLASGDTIQVRSGVLQGLGPQGPRGATGPQGIQGEIGARGEKGDVGRLDDYIVECDAVNTPVAANVDQLVSWSTSVDELSVVKSATNFGFDVQQGGAYYISGWVQWSWPADGGTGWRRLDIHASTRTTPLVSILLPAVYTTNTIFSFNTSFVADPNDIMTVTVRHNDDESLAIEAGRLNLFRVGSGPRGLTGPQGAIGPQGEQGETGPQGPAGSAGGGYATIDELGPA